MTTDPFPCQWKKSTGDRTDCAYDPDRIEFPHALPEAFVLHLIINRCNAPHECAVREVKDTNA